MKYFHIIKPAKIFLRTAALLLAAAVLFSGCSGPGAAKKSAAAPITETGFKLNTVVTVTIYDSQDKSLLAECMKLCEKYEAIFSRTDENSELYRLNHRTLPSSRDASDTFSVSQPLAELISQGLSYSRAVDGAFDIAIAPLTSLWDFTGENPEVPDEEAIRQALPLCSYTNVSADKQQITFSSPEAMLDLGAIAKGYIADKLKAYLVSRGVKSAIIDLGGNVLCIGGKSADTPFKIGIQKPFADRNETAAIMDIRDKSVVSSGIYERCFEKNGRLYHHILNPKTGFPYDNDLISVTIISDKSIDGDALSTSCFALGLEKGMEYAQSIDGIQAVFITRDYQLHYTEGFEEEIPVTEAG